MIAVIALAASASADTFTDDFSTKRPEWHFLALGSGKVEVREGVLRLDVSSPTTGKLACADLHLAITPPFTLEWDQNLLSDTRDSYWSGVALWCPWDESARLRAVLGGQGAKRRWALSGQTRADIRPNVWYALRLEVTADAQTLTVKERDSGAAVGDKVTAAKPPTGECFLSFYQNLDRFTPATGDGYAQDRGVSLIDNVRLTAAKLRPVASTAPVPKPAVVFNRKMRWLDARDGLSAGILAYDAVGDLWLTGTDSASTWLVDGTPSEAGEGHFLVVSAPAGKKSTAILRCFQFLLDAHPTLEVVAQPRNATWNLRVTVTDPYRAYQRDLAKTDGTPQRISLRDLYRRRGYDQRYAELDFVLEVASKDASAPAELRLALRLLPEPCVVARSPVVLSRAQARDGALVEAIFVGTSGELLHTQQVRLTAQVGERKASLTERANSGIFAGRIMGLAEGIHVGTVSAEAIGGGTTLATPLRIRVHDGRFVERYSAESHSYCLSDGAPLGPLLGDLLAWTPFVGIGTPDERIVHGVEEYRRLCEKDGKPWRSLELCKHRPLTRAQIADYTAYLARCGVRVIRLAPNVSPSEEYLDAGGKLAPRGLEQLSIILEEASRHGILALINLFHYQYGAASIGRNPPVQQYLDAGYRGPADFTSEKMRPLLHGYLEHLLSALRDDNAVLGYSLTGENDQIHGKDWISALFRFVKERAPRHLISYEQGGGIQHAAGRDPLGYADFEATRSAGIGYRTYYTAGHKSDCYFAVNARLYDRAAPAFLAEVASGPGWYGGAGQNWSHPDFITKVRDNFWMSLLFRQPMALSWSACLSEDERRIPTEIARAIDWNAFRRRQPLVAVRVERPDDAQLTRLMEHEAALAALALDYDYLWADAPAVGYEAVFDARKDFIAPEWGKTLPGSIRQAQPLRLSPGTSATLLEGQDGTLVAFLRNTLEYRLGPGYGAGVKELHRQRTKPREVRLEVRDRPGRCRYRVWDIDEKRVVKEGTLDSALELALGATAHDFALLMQP